MEDLKKIDLKAFVKLKPKYIRILVNENKLLGHVEQNIKTKMGMQRISLWFETEIEIDIAGSYKERPRLFHLHWIHTKSLLTLLALKPKKLYLNYYEECGRGLFKNTGIKCETLTISNKPYFDNNGYSVGMDQPYTCYVHKMART